MTLDFDPPIGQNKQTAMGHISIVIQKIDPFEFWISRSLYGPDIDYGVSTFITIHSMVILQISSRAPSF